MDRNPRFKNINISSFGLFFGALVLTLYIFTPSASAGTIIKSPAYLGLQRGLVGCWSFDGSYTQAPDCSGNNNVGTLTNGPIRTAGKIGQALDFDGVDDSVNAGSATSLDNIELQGGGGMTVSFWIKPPNTNTFGYIIGKNNGGGDGGSWNIQKNGAGNQGRLSFQKEGTVDSQIDYNSVLDANVWQHIVFTWNGSMTFSTGVALYKNGSKVVQGATIDGSGANSDASRILCIGGQSTTDIACNSSFSDEVLDDVRIYNRVLSAAEISRLYRIGLGSTANRSLTTSSFDKGLVGHWTFDGPDISGTRAKDRSGNNNHGTLTNGPKQTVGKVGQALNFDGVDDRVALPLSAPTLSPGTGDFTISMWVKWSGLPAANLDYLIHDRGGGTQNYIIFVSTSNRLQCDFGDGTNTASAITVSNYLNTAVDTWRHYVCIRQGTTVSLYDNGSLIASGTNASLGDVNTEGTWNPQIGSDITGGAEGANAVIDDVRIYKRALPAGEIQRLYNSTQSKYNASKTDSLTKGLVGYWTFDGADIFGTSVRDKSGNNNHGTLFNSPIRDIGKIGQAMSFDDTTDEVDNDSASLNLTTAVSVSAWVKKTSGFNASSVIAGRDGGGHTTAVEQYSLMAHNTANSVKFNVSNGTALLTSNTSTTAVKDGIWYYLVGIYDGVDTTSLYLDGVLVDSDTSGGYGSLQSPGGADFVIGDAFTGGTVDDVRVYNRALNASEVNKLYQMGR